MEDLSTKEIILNSAFSLFLVKGYNGVSIKDIIQKANVSRGALYHYFRNKDELFVTVIETSFLHEFDNILNEISDKNLSFEKKTFWIFQASIEMTKFLEQQVLSFSSPNKFYSYYQLIFDSISLFPELHKKYKNLYANLEIQIKDMIEAGKVTNEVNNDINSGSIAFQIIAGLEGIMIMKTILIEMDIETKVMELYHNTMILLENKKS